MSTTELREMIGTTAQVLFYFVMAVIGVLTYRRASKTVFQPLETEVFKRQLDELKELLGLFIGKSETELRDESGIPKTYLGNVWKLAGDYAKIMFPNVELPSPGPWEGPDFPGGLMPLEVWRRTSMTQYDNVKLEPDPPITDDARKHVWACYVYEEIILSDTYMGYDAKLKRILESPILPSQIAALVEDYRRALRESIDRISSVLTTHAKAFPEHYPTWDALKEAQFLWVLNQFNTDHVPLKPRAEAIATAVRAYVRSDLVVKK